jgi:hypothetical protein
MEPRRNPDWPKYVQSYIAAKVNVSVTEDLDAIRGAPLQDEGLERVIMDRVFSRANV